MRVAKHLSVALAIAAFAIMPARAAVHYGIACESGGDLKQLIREGTGTRELMKGIGSVAAWCVPAGEVQMIRVGLEGPALDTLKAIAAMPAADDVAVHTKIEWPDADNPEGEATRHAIGWKRERSFGDLRKELDSLAKPTGQFVDDTGYRTYHGPQCAEPVIPIRYYIATKAPFPGCNGGRLIQDGETRATMEAE